MHGATNHLTMKKVQIQNISGQPILLETLEEEVEVETHHFDEKGNKQKKMLPEKKRTEIVLQPHETISVSKEEAEKYTQLPNIALVPAKVAADPAADEQL